MSETDSAKLAAVTISVRQMAQEFGFSTFPPEDLTIDEDSYRPQKEGYEIGLETSASDAIRLKWAYPPGLPELGHSSARSEEHTSELQSLMRNSYAVFRLKNTLPHYTTSHTR